MPLYAHLLAICRRGVAQARSAERLVACPEAYIALPPLGRERLRPRAMKGEARFYIDVHTHTPNANAAISVVDASGCDPVPVAGNGIVYSVGIHPCNIPSNFQDEIQRITLLSLNESIAAIGECGFDRTSKYSVELQKSVFSELAAISRKEAMPMLIHCVHATDLLLQFSGLMPGEGMWIVHGFRGKPATMLQLIKAGFSVSFGAKANIDSVKACPDERIFLETDTTMPTSLCETYNCFSALRGENLESVVARNFMRIFGEANSIGLENNE